MIIHIYIYILYNDQKQYVITYTVFYYTVFSHTVNTDILLGVENENQNVHPCWDINLQNGCFY